MAQIIHLSDEPDAIMARLRTELNLPDEGPEHIMVQYLLHKVATELAAVCSILEAFPADVRAYDWVTATLRCYAEITAGVLVVDDPIPGVGED